MTNENITVSLVSDTGYCLWHLTTVQGFAVRAWLEGNVGPYDKRDDHYSLTSVASDSMVHALTQTLKEVRAQRDSAWAKLEGIEDAVRD